MAPDFAPRAVYLDEPTPYIHITVNDGNLLLFPFSTIDFLDIGLEFAPHLDGNFGSVNKCERILIH